ncbi:rhodanese-like domain-containing protein [Pseudonocardia halophobica]|uniref:Sulfurtransferase n=1 Tax=Pseudonocardia halophobica TaxID=29401 RepID=A0A9W6L0Z5_9PSEU|nr:rhodanese-like domain-containing protein [Pseudonocardia halophobica]GLL11747.1 sulfurtransferase [Pseudonocardia halophobica]
MTISAPVSPVLAVPPGSPAEAAAHFAARLTFFTDVSDVHAALGGPEPGFVLVDTRSRAAWDQRHVPGAVHHPHAALPGDLDPAVPVVTYCWGPGCDGATRGALELARAGFRVKEMLGGIEYWIREGFAVETIEGVRENEPDPLTTPCGC